MDLDYSRGYFFRDTVIYRAAPSDDDNDGSAQALEKKNDYKVLLCTVKSAKNKNDDRQ